MEGRTGGSVAGAEEAGVEVPSSPRRFAKLKQLEVDPDAAVSVGPGPVPEPGQELRKTPDGLLRSADVLFESPEVKVVSGALEGSNVNVINSLVTMIDLARRFETQVKLMQSAEKNRDSLSQIMKLN